MKFLAAIFAALAAPLLPAAVTLAPDTPVFSGPAHNTPIIAVTGQPLTVESLQPEQVIVSRHPLARFFMFTPVRLPDGRTGFADESVTLKTANQRPTLVFAPYRPFWRDAVIGLTAIALILLGYDWHRRKNGRWFHYAGIPALVRILLLMLLVRQAGNLIASPVDEVGYFANLASFLRKDFSVPWHYTVGTSILYAPFAWVYHARNVGDIVIPFSYFSGFVLAPLTLIFGYFIGKKLTGSPLKSSIAMLLWAVWPFFFHHFAGFGIRQFWSYAGLPSAGFTFRHYVNLIGASYNAMSDTPSTCAMLLVMVIVLYGKSRWHTAAAAGLLYGFACTIRINNILFAPILALMGWHFQRPLFRLQHLLTAGVCFVTGFLPQFWANACFFGNPLRFSYTNYANGAHTYLHWIFFRTTAAYYGAANHFLWVPAAAALWVMRDRRLRLLLTVWAVPVILFFTLYSHGTDDAVRFVLTSYPALFLAVTSCGIWETLSRKGRIAAAAEILLLLLIPANVTHAGKCIWYPWRTMIPAAGFCCAARNRAMIFFLLTALLHIFGNGYIVIALLAGSLLYALAENLILRQQQTQERNIENE